MQARVEEDMGIVGIRQCLRGALDAGCAEGVSALLQSAAAATEKLTNLYT